MQFLIVNYNQLLDVHATRGGLVKDVDATHMGYYYGVLLWGIRQTLL